MTQKEEIPYLTLNLQKIFLFNISRSCFCTLVCCEMTVIIILNKKSDKIKHEGKSFSARNYYILYHRKLITERF